LCPTDGPSRPRRRSFTRRRHDPAFPARAVEYCLDQAGATLADVAAIAYYEDPALKFHRVLATYLGAVPFGLASFRDTLPGWWTSKRRITDVVRREPAALDRGPVPAIVCRRHHESHAASAFYASPYESAAVLCIDGVGEWATTTLWHGRGTTLEPLAEIRFPHSLGLSAGLLRQNRGFFTSSTLTSPRFVGPRRKTARRCDGGLPEGKTGNDGAESSECFDEW
jgi:predicted NodU family carbamoyl transferase